MDSYVWSIIRCRYLFIIETGLISETFPINKPVLVVKFSVEG